MKCNFLSCHSYCRGRGGGTKVFKKNWGKGRCAAEEEEGKVRERCSEEAGQHNSLLHFWWREGEKGGEMMENTEGGQKVLVKEWEEKTFSEMGEE